MRSTMGYILLASIFEAMGDYSFKNYAKKRQTNDLVIGSLTYVAMISVLIKVWEVDSLAVTNSLWNDMSLILHYWVGVTMFNEEPTKMENMAMLLSFTGGSIASFEKAHGK